MDNKLKQALGIPDISGDFLQANWYDVAPPNVHTLMTTRKGGVSTGVFQGLNVGNHVGDDPEKVAQNRALVQNHVPVPLVYLNQIHSVKIVNACEAHQNNLNNLNNIVDADASIDNTGTVACAVMTADCLPVLFCDKAGTTVAAAHAGWRGLANGVLQNTVREMEKLGVSPDNMIVWLGAGISADAFEVGQDVLDSFMQKFPDSNQYFNLIDSGTSNNSNNPKYLADMYGLARLVLKHEGINPNYIFGGEYCTVLDREHFYSYRRDGQTGRMVTAIWLEKSHSIN